MMERKIPAAHRMEGRFPLVVKVPPWFAHAHGRAAERMSSFRCSSALALTLMAGGCAVLASCAGAVRCGQGRINTAGSRPGPASQTSPAGGPYCLVVEAEGVGNVNLAVNAPITQRSPSEEGDEGEGVGQGPGGPVTYTLSQPANVQFIDVCSTPGARRVLPATDDASAQIPEPDAPPIPFPVRVYDVQATPPFTVASNGWLSFVSGAPLGPLSGSIPSATAPNLLAAPYWTDLVTRGGICYGTVGRAPHRAWVVQWDDLYEYAGSANAHLTFEVIVREIRPPLRHNVIDFVYQRIDGTTRTTVAAGIENQDGSAGVAVPGPFGAPRAVRFTPSR